MKKLIWLTDLHLVEPGRDWSQGVDSIRQLRKRDLETLRLVTQYQGHSVPDCGRCLARWARASRTLSGRVDPGGSFRWNGPTFLGV
jgi:hypothetical protein